MKSFFKKIKPKFKDYQEIGFKLKYKTFTEQELTSWVNNKEWSIRCLVASHGYGLDKLEME